MADTHPRDILLADEEATLRLGEDVALALRPGDVVALQGDLGAGKTTLARAIIRSLRADPDLDVPSPTYTLVQDYEGAPRLTHADLYRLGHPEEAEELGLREAATDSIVLLEWPEKGAGHVPPPTLRIVIADHGGVRRVATVSGTGETIRRVRRSLAIRDFLVREGRRDARRAPLSGDASARRYEIVSRPASADRILMDAPPLVLGPPVRGGKSYAEIAHTARSVDAFVAVGNALRRNAVAAPEILGMDLAHGFLLLQHLGSAGVLDADGRPIVERYQEAARLLAAIHAAAWERRLPVTGTRWHVVPPFDRPALSIEVSLLIDWYVPWKTGGPAGEALRTAFDAAWNIAFERLKRAEKSLVLRDYHSPNLIWRREKKGLERIGVLDFQDALIGPAAYDVASLGMDARVTVEPEVEAAVTEAYVEARRASGRFDEPAFREAYAICAAQRNSKILGIFVRLKERDGKPDYIRHVPRIRTYLRRALTHPSLAPVADLYAAHGLLKEDKRA